MGVVNLTSVLVVRLWSMVLCASSCDDGRSRGINWWNVLLFIIIGCCFTCWLAICAAVYLETCGKPDELGDAQFTQGTYKREAEHAPPPVATRVVEAEHAPPPVATPVVVTPELATTVANHKTETLENPVGAAGLLRTDAEQDQAKETSDAAFALYDVDHSGTLTKDECFAFIVSRELGLSREYLEGAWSVYDTNGDGVLDQQEFASFYKVMLQGHKRRQMNVVDVHDQL